MDHAPPKQFGLIQTYRTRGYSIDGELRHAHRTQRGRRRGFPILRAPTARLLRNGRER